MPAERIEAEIDGRVGKPVDEPGLRHQLHPRADAGRAGAHPHQAEIAVFKRPKDPVQQQCSVWLTARLVSGQRLLPLDQVDKIAVAILEEDEPVSLVFVRRSQKFDVLSLQLGMSLVKILHRDRNVAQSFRAECCFGPGALRRYDFNHAAILRPYEEVAVILVALLESEFLDIPVGQRFRVGRGNRKVLNSSEHIKMECIRHRPGAASRAVRLIEKHRARFICTTSSRQSLRETKALALAPQLPYCFRSMSMAKRPRLQAIFGVTLAVLCCACGLRAQDEQNADDPTHGVARISVIQGEVNVKRGDSGDVVAAALNAPLMSQDHIETADGSRSEIQFDAANMVRLAPNTDVALADVQRGRYQLQVGAGTIIFRVIRDSQAEAEIDTPSISVRPTGRGIIRVSVGQDGATEVTVRSGAATIFSPSGSQPLHSGQTMLVRGTSADPEFQVEAEVSRDQFDDWSNNRDQQLTRSRSYQYVSTRHLRRRRSGRLWQLGAHRATVTCGLRGWNPVGRRIIPAAGCGKTTTAGPGSIMLPGAGLRSTMAAGL